MFNISTSVGMLFPCLWTYTSKSLLLSTVHHFVVLVQPFSNSFLFSSLIFTDSVQLGRKTDNVQCRDRQMKCDNSNESSLWVHQCGILFMWKFLTFFVCELTLNRGSERSRPRLEPLHRKLRKCRWYTPFPAQQRTLVTEHFNKDLKDVNRLTCYETVAVSLREQLRESVSQRCRCTLPPYKRCKPDEMLTTNGKINTNTQQKEQCSRDGKWKPIHKCNTKGWQLNWGQFCKSAVPIELHVLKGHRPGERVDKNNLFSNTDWKAMSGDEKVYIVQPQDCTSWPGFDTMFAAISQKQKFANWVFRLQITTNSLA